ncbi:Eco57I restriction-modification methylase domain-containing protein [Methylobacterium fujisawaense]|uniref:Eco57I restriction-modification methylase domain-containing protein n=1 Tax=Methylobacterium fujisawaense TaxID=107400 RepID=UPI0036F8F0A9
MNFMFPAAEPVDPKGRYAALSADKLRGGYYTPARVAEWLCAWAIRDKTNEVLEPSCGAGAFATAAAQRLRSLKATAAAAARQLTAVELVEAEAAKARDGLASPLGKAASKAVVEGDFFAWWERRKGEAFDAVVGNPPFIRYQSFPEPARSRAMAMMESIGFKPNRLTNIWVPFVVASAEALRPGGRLAMIIPAELLQVTYAAQLRSYLTAKFRHIDIVACNDLFFEGAEQEVVLLMADGALPERLPNNVCRVAVTEVATVRDLLVSEPTDLLSRSEEKDVRGDKEKWLKYFLSGREIGLLRELREHRRVVPLGMLADVDVGIVTGANAFFVLRRSEIEQRRLKKFARRLVSRSAHLRGASLSDEDWIALEAGDERVTLLDIRAGVAGLTPGSAAAAYVAQGEADDVHRGYKCSIRRPWFHVPAIWSPDAFLFRQIHDFPRLVLNGANATATDTIHRVRARAVDAAVLVAGSYTHLTAASAEIEGRSYGGGVLELEPTEAERLLVPDAQALAAALPLTECDKLVRAGKLSDVLAENDRLVLQNAMGLSKDDVSTLKGAWDRMRGRRFSRGKSARAKA